jgi:peptide/nickel transport system ATP-binding protein
MGFQTERGFVKVLDNINFNIKKGETVGIVGESGSGKTLLSLSLMQLLDRSARQMNGDIYFNSSQFGRVNLKDIPREQIRKIRGKEISMIFQEPMTSLNPVYTCGNQVAEMIHAHENVSLKEAKSRVIALFERVHLPNPQRIYNAYPHELSGGQKQRVMIAIALACHPDLLIADEPTTALDVTVQAAVLDIIRELRDSKETTIIFISHDLGVIAEIADRVIVMHKGKIVEEGNVWDIFANPQHPYTKGLLACRPRLDIKMKVLPTISDFMEINVRSGDIQTPGAKFSSVGQALMMNYVSEEEIRERNDKLKQQTPILKVENLTSVFKVKSDSFFGKAQKSIVAVDSVSFEVYPGETLGLVGESGCGKTTLGRSILRLNEPQSGHVFFQGKDILALDDRQMRGIRREMQIIFQDPYSSLNPRKTIGEAILEPMRFHKIFYTERERKDYVIELLETVNLSAAHFHYFPHEFSGGERQRICIARSLALKPKFLICDESVSALDVSVQAQVLNLLNRLKKLYDFTYIFISHDLAVVKFISDRIAVMKDGKIVEIGYANDIYEHPKEAYTEKLIKSIPNADLENIRRNMLKRKLQKSKTV